jgi:hypothetical protein
VDKVPSEEKTWCVFPAMDKVPCGVERSTLHGVFKQVAMDQIGESQTWQHKIVQILATHGNVIFIQSLPHCLIFLRLSIKPRLWTG